LQVGLIGCGTLGCTLGHRLLRAGHALVVHDRDPQHAKGLLKAGATWSDDPGGVASGSGLILSALPRPEDVEAVFPGEGGVWSFAARHTLHVETSTVGPASDDDVSLVMWVGGSADYYDLARPLLEVLVDRVVYCGGVGHGQVTKLLNNLIAHSLIVIVGEALTLGVKSGLSLDVMHTALQEGTGQTRMLDEVLPGSVFRGDWRPGLTVDLALKDLALARKLSEEHDVELAALGRFEKFFESAIERGWGEQSAHSVIRLLEESAGVELRSQILEPLQPPRGDSSDD
jgi:3-hydroxyisobutyrate dehydrogenase-like beta-hydroxyacid dehydrogenase